MRESYVTRFYVTHDCCRRRQNDPCAGILLTQPKTLQNVAYARFAPNCGGVSQNRQTGSKAHRRQHVELSHDERLDSTIFRVKWVACQVVLSRF